MIFGFGGARPKLSLSGSPVVWEEFGEPCYWMGRNAGENVLEPREGIDADPLTGCGKAAKDSSDATPVVTTKEDPIVPTDGNAANRAFRAVIIDLQIPVFREARQSRPVFQGVAPSGLLGNTSGSISSR
jgi:hypothetical protein